MYRGRGNSDVEVDGAHGVLSQSQCDIEVACAMDAQFTLDRNALTRDALGVSWCGAKGVEDSSIVGSQRVKPNEWLKPLERSG